MRISKLLFVALLMCLAAGAFAHIPPHAQKGANATTKKATYRDVCSNSESAIDQEINNVRARLLGGGDCWWNFSNGRYIVPKVDPGSGQQEVSSLYAGSVWLGGIDPGGSLKLACQTFRNGANNDFWPGPLNLFTGTTESFQCSNWDRHFRVTGDEVRQHLANIAAGNLDETLIPRGVKGWPGRGNKFFFDVWGFDLPTTPQGLAGFYDAGPEPNGIYNPLEGDFPIIEIRGCDQPTFPDEMIFWIYNDHGGGQPHANTLGSAIQMEVQVQAFGYKTNDELNDMTFQRYKLINRAPESIDSTFFAMWIDPDLGCSDDDYVGCDTSRSLMYVYNQDAADGNPGCTCASGGGSTTYCEDIPILGVDYFRGPLDTSYTIIETIGGVTTARDTFIEIGMSAFTYYNRGGDGVNPNTADPNLPEHYYNYLTGSWRDGTPFTFGGSGYNPNDPNAIPVDYAFIDPPNSPSGWSMCSEGLTFGDRRTIQASGPLLLDPGEVNELIIGVPWVPSIDYPCPDLEPLFRADQLAQGLFDNCFELVDGPDAPSVSWIELDKQIIAVLTNDSASNNYREAYSERDILAPDSIGTDEASYLFEGYIVYQVLNSNVSSADFSNPTFSRLAAQVDVRNGVSKIYNWVATANPNNPGEVVYTPELRVEGSDAGIKHTFSLTEDLFATGNDRKLINHKKYYYAVVAYAYNDYKTFDPLVRPELGQLNNYLLGRRNTQIYTVIPRPIIDKVLQSTYGEQQQITRLEGQGSVAGIFLDWTDETYDKLFTPNFDSILVYKTGQGPVKVNIFNPFEVRNGTYELRIVDANVNDNKLDNDARWELRQLPGGPVIASERSIDQINEQIVSEYGFSVEVAQPDEPGELPEQGNGAVGGEVIFDNPDSTWLVGLTDDYAFGNFSAFFLNYIRTNNPLDRDHPLDPEQRLSTLANNGWFSPYVLATWEYLEVPDNEFVVTPAWTENTTGQQGANNAVAIGNGIDGRRARLARLNNVDIVFTSDKTKWSRCVVIETASYYYSGSIYPKDPLLTIESPVPPGRKRLNFDTRFAQPVGKDDLDGDGLPDPDGTKDPVTGRDMLGMSWFPGYAIDVETGQRLNIFFGENSVYSKKVNPNYTGRDLMFNPSGDIFYDDGLGAFQYYEAMLGGQHMVYVTDMPYDSCKTLWRQLSPELYPNDAISAIRKRDAIKNITWSGIFTLNGNFQMRSLNDGLIPDDVRVKMRVNNRFNNWWDDVTGAFTGHPRYQFTIENRESLDITQEDSWVNNALDSIKVVPNPYYAFSDYETSQFSNTVKITNLPGTCTVTIYSLDGKFIRQYKRAEVYQPYNQISPAVEWDLENNKGIPVASGVYLIHVDAPGLGRRTIKWFGVARQFDPSGL